jgi:DNA-binding MarR family transcriptional regulator
MTDSKGTAAPTPHGSTQQKRLRANEKKWTPELMAAGWTMVPSVLMEHQRELGLNPIQFNILMHLAKHWWKETPPFVSKRTIAAAIRMSPRTVQRNLTALEQAGLVRREKRYRQNGGRTSNSYVFDGLIEKAKPYAASMVERRQKRAADATAEKVRKLHVVK